MGCLRALFVRVGCLVLLVAAIVLGIVYRRAILDYIDAWRGHPNEVYASPAAGGVARPSTALGRLEQRGGPAYEDLTAADLAALVESALSREHTRVLDSVQVALLENEVRVRGSLDLTGVPRNLLGPLASALRSREPAAIGGPLSVDSTGHLQLTVTYLTLHDFPFPRGTIPRILGAAHVPGARGATVPIPLAARLGDVRVSPSYVRFYRSAQR
jgi:hypothetical protein